MIASIATRQHGVVARRQLLAGGLTGRAIDRRIESGHLHRLGSGVYAVGHETLGREARWMAAVLAAGPGAVLSHRSAAELWGVVSARSGAIHVTCARHLHAGRHVIRHRSALPGDETTVEDGVPVTTVPRTILDLAALAPRHVIENALHEAEHRRLHDEHSVLGLLERHPGRRGCAALRAIFAERTVARTRSPLEGRFLIFLERAGLPRPETNVSLDLGAGRFIEADCLWRGARLIAELDSRSWHDDDRSFEADRLRDRALLTHDWRVVRITWRQLHRDPEALAADLRLLLGRSGGSVPTGRRLPEFRP